MDTIKTQLIDSFVKEFRPQNVRFNDTFNLSLFDFTYDLYNITMQTFYMDYDKSEIKYYADAPNIRMTFYNLEMKLGMNFSLTANPEFYRDVGPGQFAFAFENMTIGLTLVEDNGVFQLRTEEINAAYMGGDTFFRGTGDLSFALDSVTTLVEQQMLSNPGSTLTSIITPLLGVINGKIAAAGCRSEQGGLHISWCSMGNPIFTNDSMSIVFDGEVRPTPDAKIPFEDQKWLPIIHSPTEKDVQLFISAYTLNTTLWSLHQNGNLTFEIRTLDGTPEGPKLTAQTLAILFPGLTEKVGADTQISIMGMASNDVAPNLNITNGETYVNMQIEFSFATVDSTGSRTSFLQMTSGVRVEIDLEIQEPFTLKTDIRQLKIKAQRIDLDEYNLTNVEDLNAIIGTISGFIRNYANRMLSGYKLGEIDLGFIKMDVSQTQLMEVNNYIYGNMAPKFTHRIEPQRNGRLENIVRKEYTYEDKVKAVANLLKLTPLYQNIKQFKENQHVYESLNNIGAFNAFKAHEESMPLEKKEGCESEDLTNIKMEEVNI